MQLAREDTRRKLTQEAFQQAGDGVGVPMLVRGQKIDVTLCGKVRVSSGHSYLQCINRYRPLLKRSFSALMTAELPLRR